MIIGEGGLEPEIGEAGSELIIIGEGGLELLLLPKEVGGESLGIEGRESDDLRVGVWWEDGEERFSVEHMREGGSELMYMTSGEESEEAGGEWFTIGGEEHTFNIAGRGEECELVGDTFTKV